MRAFLFMLMAITLATGEDKDPRLAIDAQDLGNLIAVSRRTLGTLPAQEMVYVAQSIQRLEAIADKIPKPAPKPEPVKPKE